jgi:hypothetical protein
MNVRSAILNLSPSSDNFWYNAFGEYNVKEKPDADQEEIVGKTINLLTTTPSLPNTIRLLVVAQSIKDIGTKDGIPVKKFSKKYPKSAEIICKKGQFDYTYIDEGGPTATKKDEFITYFDEITGEIKMLVTIDRDPFTGKMTIRNIEYLE